MKKISKILLIFVLGFIFLGIVDAKNYEFSCDYKNYSVSKTDVVTLSFKLDGNTLTLLKYKYKGKEVKDVSMQPTSWTHGNYCPSSFETATNAPVDNPKSVYVTDDYTGEYDHFWTWDCTYIINDDDEAEGITELSIQYERTDKIQYYYSSETQDFVYRYNGDKYKDYKKGTISDESSSVSSKKCIPATFTIKDKDKTIDITFKDDGKIKGHLNNFKNNRSTDSENKSACYEYTDKDKCRVDSDVACVWNENENAPNGGYCNVDNLLFVGCGGASDIPMQVPALISLCINLLKIATPIILIFISLITLVKAMAAGKEDEIKKATSSLVKKMIAAALVFFVIAIVQFVMSKVASDGDYAGITNCFNCFLNNDCKVETYYKTVVSGEDYCTPLTTGATDTCDNLFK